MAAKDSVEKTQEEIIKEIAKALGHTGYLLDAVLEEMKQLEYKMVRTIEKDDYNNLVDKFNMKRQEALFRRDMLIIHREAIGVRQHKFLDKYYPIPEKKEKKT
ncbi:MAG: hypothetical protein J7J85_01250 [Deltaproteobacteria bacterium]|nr:hypothetical protein [Deltaproteobacteria bacterium]